MSTAALILAGGRASRMGGGDKPLRLLAGRPILAHILDCLSSEHAEIAISANGDPSRLAVFGRSVLADDVSSGPLGGILAGLLWAASRRADHLLTVPGDGPFVPGGLAACLAPSPAMAASNGRRHPTVALWPVTAAALLRSHLASRDPECRRDFSVAAFADRIGMRVVAFEAARDPFFNINTPDDLARAETLFGC